MTEPLGRHIVLGMAGHIDHGKTEIVKALTGTDTDRLKEEKERGMTTDLGFAFLGDDITIIDVPGHEKFVRTMVAGVNTVDLGLLVIAADDGVMPQTIEHLEILNLLQVSAGLVAVSKIDLVEEDWLQLVIDDIKKLVRGTVLDAAPIVPVSPVSGQGIEDLKNSIFQSAKTVRQRRDKGVFRLPIDRVFTIKGFGTVVAGTVLSGRISVEDTVELLPEGKILRVRGLQVHDRPVKESGVGFRTAINLLGVMKESVKRGDVLAEPGFFRPTSMVDAHFSYLSSSKKELKNRTRVRVHAGTCEAIARLILLDNETLFPGDDGFVQIHFEKPVLTDHGDRYVIRSYSPIRTIGGGLILDVHPMKHKRLQPELIEKLTRLYQGDPSQVVLEQLEKSWFMPVAAEELAKSLGSAKDDVIQHLSHLEEDNAILRVGKKRWLSRNNYDILRHKIIHLLETYHRENPLRINMATAELRSRIKQPVDRNLFDEVVSDLHVSGALIASSDRVRLKDHVVRLTPELQDLRKKIESRFLDDPINPPAVKFLVEEWGDKAEGILGHMMENGDLIRLDGGVVLHKDAVKQAEMKVKSFLEKKGAATVSELKQELNTTRKFAVPLLIHLDNSGVTERDGDLRRLRE